MKCTNCGADAAKGADRCAYCGSALARPAVPDKASLFAAVKTSPEYAQSESPERLAQLPKFSAFHWAFLVVFFTMFIGGAGFIFIMMLGMGGAFAWLGFRLPGGLGAGFSVVPLFMSLMPLAFIVLGVLMFRHVRQRMSKVESAPVKAVPVIVINKRLETFRRSDSSSTHYFVTCELESGERDEFQVWDGRVYGRMTVDDAGVLFLRDRYGVDFDRVAL